MPFVKSAGSAHTCFLSFCPQWGQHQQQADNWLRGVDISIVKLHRVEWFWSKIKQYIKGLPDTSYLSLLNTRTSDLLEKLESNGFKSNKRIFLFFLKEWQSTALTDKVFFKVRRLVGFKKELDVYVENSGFKCKFREKTWFLEGSIRTASKLRSRKLSWQTGPSAHLPEAYLNPMTDNWICAKRSLRNSHGDWNV